jgi:hypothetical protein
MDHTSAKPTDSELATPRPTEPQFATTEAGARTRDNDTRDRDTDAQDEPFYVNRPHDPKREAMRLRIEAWSAQERKTREATRLEIESWKDRDTSMQDEHFYVVRTYDSEGGAVLSPFNEREDAARFAAQSNGELFIPHRIRGPVPSSGPLTLDFVLGPTDGYDSLGEPLRDQLEDRLLAETSRRRMAFVTVRVVFEDA